jgi:hypothetical protein
MYKIAAVVAPEVTRPSIATTLSLSTSLLKLVLKIYDLLDYLLHY